MAVQKITDSEFDDQLNTSSKVVVKYYADWCGSCKLFAPKFNRLSADTRFSDVVFLDVNAEKSPIARKKAGVTNLPYFAIFKNGQLIETVATSKEDAVVELLSKLN